MGKEEREEGISESPLPHNPFLDKQTLDFQIPHLLRPHDILKYSLYGPPGEMKW